MANNQAFDSAITVTPVDTHRYTAMLDDAWCIGTVPHGGYSTAVLHRLATTHFAHTHPGQYPSEPATPISMQLVFLRRTGAGPAVLTVQDTKLGARTSTIHVTLSQASEKKKGELEDKIAGYVTVSPASAEVGITAPTAWSLHPPPPAGSGAGGAVDLEKLGASGRDGAWTRLEPPFSEFRRAAQQTEIFGPDPVTNGPRVVDQWARFRPGGSADGRWTDEAVVYLADMFPMALDGFDTMGEGAGEQGAKFWYPTVTLNVDVKKRLPTPGPRWLYSRVQTRAVRDGRTDLDVVVLDEEGDVVLLSTQVGLVVSASRNIGKRELKQKL